MSYNIMGKNASFKGDISGTIENQVNDWDNQSISGNKTFTAAITSSADVMLSGSGKVSASFFYGDGSGLSGVGGTITSYSNHATDRLIAGGASSTAIKGLSTVTFTGGKLGVTGQISASLGVSGSEFHGDGSNLTAVTASFVTASNVVGTFDASKITAGTFADARIPNLDTAKITTGTFADARISEASVTQHQTALGIAGGQLTGDQSIVNARLQNTVSVVNVTASGHMSASTFHGNGAALTGVTATPSPAGANTQIQFNNNGAIAADADLTFLTGSNTLATSNLSASVNISGSSLYLQDEIIVGGNTFLNSEGNIAIVNEITASSEISSSADIYGAAFIGDGRQLSGAPVDTAVANAVVTVFNATDKTITSNANFKYDGSDVTVTSGDVKATNLSASANVQVGGHITGSGNIVLTGSSNSIIFDMASNDGPSITSDGENVLTIDGDNTLKLRGDNYVTIQQNTTDKLNFNFSSNKMVTAMVLSSSAAVSASIVDSLTGYKIGNQTFINADANMTVGTIGGTSFSGSSFVSASIVDSLTGYKLGDQTVMDSNANVTCGTIGSQNISIVYDDDVSANALDFGAGAISGSGNISGSAFYGDGSNLQNVQATPQFRYYNLNAYAPINTGGKWLYARTNNTATDNPDASLFLKWVAPGSGSIVRWVITPTHNSAGTADASGFMQTSFLKNNFDVNANSSGVRTAHVTASFNRLLTITNGAATLDVSSSVVDWTGTSLTVSGSNSFDPGDILLFGVKAENNHGDCAVSILFKIDESITYP